MENQLRKKYEDSRVEVTELFKELSSWREESHQQFANIINVYRRSITKAIDALVEEICDLQSQPSKERNDSIEVVNNLGDEIIRQSSKFPIKQAVNLDPPAVDGSGMESPDGQQNTESAQSLNELTFNALPDMDVDEWDEADEVSHMCPQCDEVCTSDYLRIHLETVHPKLELSNENPAVLDTSREESENDGQNEDEILQNIEIQDVEEVSHSEVSEDDGQKEVAILQNNEISLNQEIEIKSDRKVHSKRSIEGVHDKRRRRVCGQCGYTASLKRDLKKHMEALHETGADFKCVKCPYTTDKKGSLKIHIEAVHDRIKDHICRECGYAASRKYILKKHIENVHNKVCGECGTGFILKSALEDHIEAVHEQTKRLTCKDCGYVASQRHYLKRHIKIVHEKIRDHVCPDCGYAAFEKNDLNRHIEAVHLKIKTHVCGVCGYVASQKCHLKTHIDRVHEKVRNHVCEVCGYAALQKGILKRHIKTVHEKIKEPSL